MADGCEGTGKRMGVKGEIWDSERGDGSLKERKGAGWLVPR